MRHLTGRSRGNPRTAEFMIKVTSKDGVSWQGSIEHVQSGQVQRFRSCLEMVILIQEKLDELGVPQPTTELRSWPGRALLQHGPSEEGRRDD